MTNNVTLHGFDEFARDMKKLSGAMQQSKAMSALEAGGYVIMSHAQEYARNKLNKHPTGFLTNSIGVKRLGNLILVGVFGVVYAKAHEFGTTIFPKKGPFLAFQVDGKWVFTKKVVLPARPFLRPAVDNNLSSIREAIVDALRGLLQGAI